MRVPQTRTASRVCQLRQLHVQAAPTHSPLAPQASPDVVPPQQTAPLFTTLGQPPSLLQVSLSPSLPTYIQSGTILTLSPLRNVTATPFWLSPMKRLLLGWHSWRYHKLESTVPASALIKSSKGDGLYVLAMDGKEDYAVFGKSALLSFAGPALRVGTLRVPLKVQRTKEGTWFGTKSETKDSGLGRTLGYTLLQGRGDVVLQGKGEVYKLVLGASEEVVVKRDSLVGVSITGELDCVESWTLASQTGPAAIATVAVADESTELIPTSQWTQIKSHVLATYNSAKHFVFRSWSYISPAGSAYVKITGPRTVLLQSGTAAYGFGSFSQLFKSGEPISVVEAKLQLAARDYKPEDLLSYAIVKDGKVTFHSTPDFSETVQKLEAAGGKK